jgi:hypothetical protein
MLSVITFFFGYTYKSSKVGRSNKDIEQDHEERKKEERQIETGKGKVTKRCPP